MSEDLESSLQLFNGLLHSKDDQITHLKLEANELHRELDLLRMKENNLKDMQVTVQSCYIFKESNLNLYHNPGLGHRRGRDDLQA